VNGAERQIRAKAVHRRLLHGIAIALLESTRCPLALLQEELPDAAVVSIAHRETVARYHRQRWHFSRKDADSNVSSLSIQPL